MLRRIRAHYRALRYLGLPRWYCLVRSVLEK